MAIILAPMEGVVDPVIRDLLTRRGGYDLCVTEFIRITHQLLPEKVFYRYAPELRNGSQTQSGTPVLVQLLGSNLDNLLVNAERALSLGAPGFDLNFGCPAKTVNRHEGGAKLLETPEKLFSIISYLRKHLPSQYTLSAKIRLGYKDKSLFDEILSAIKESSPSWLTIHARTKQEAYIPPAHWEYIAKAREAIDCIPVIANGDIWTVEDARRCVEVTKCADLMLGRGAIADPSLALKIKKDPEIYKLTRSFKAPTLESMYPQIFRPADILENSSHTWVHNRRLLNLMSVHPHYLEREELILPKLKQWTRQLSRHYAEADQLFQSIKRLKTRDQLNSEWRL